MTSAPPTTEKPLSDALPFSDIAAEQALLNAAMWSDDAYDLAARYVNHAAFYRPAHDQIWAAMAVLRATGAPTGPVAVSDALRAAGATADTLHILPRIYTQPPSLANIAYNARLVARAAVRRHTYSAAVRAAQATTLADHQAFRDELTRAIERLTALASAWDSAS